MSIAIELIKLCECKSSLGFITHGVWYHKLIQAHGLWYHGFIQAQGTKYHGFIQAHIQTTSTQCYYCI